MNKVTKYKKVLLAITAVIGSVVATSTSQPLQKVKLLDIDDRYLLFLSSKRILIPTRTKNVFIINRTALNTEMARYKLLEPNSIEMDLLNFVSDINRIIPAQNNLVIVPNSEIKIGTNDY